MDDIHPVLLFVVEREEQTTEASRERRAKGPTYFVQHNNTARYGLGNGTFNMPT